MPSIEVEVSCPVYDSFRVQQISGIFDVPIEERVRERFHVDMPELGDDWRVGLIVGPSGSGKSTMAKRIFGDHVWRGRPWPDDRAVVDCLGERPIKEITGLFTAVGFSSPPSWIKPYEVLSGGERFRCDLARALVESDNCCVFDEFTSVVDRNVAKIGSAAVARAVRGGRVNCRFVAVTCHYDVAEWLEPDWTLDMATSTFHRRCLRRPEIELEIFRCRRNAWRMFARYHYLTGALGRGARCYMALWRGVPVAFCATLALIGRRDRWRISRLVTLPDYQGVGIGTGTARAVAELHLAQGHRLNITAGHPALIAHCRHSPLWRTVNVKKLGAPRDSRRFARGYRGSPGRTVVSFEFVGSQSPVSRASGD
ncbi:MAG: hypothetical protein JXM70_14670 [Pirellulales bacterium]|nr:hypothetical protein [Pirellulales bacterium]